MTEAVLGLDTSNYRTSMALVTMEGEILLDRRKLLPVQEGQRGLRQSDAVYAHLKGMKLLLDEEFRAVCAAHPPAAVCASVTPRDSADSYMPVFEAGDAMGRGIAASRGIPFFPTDHQHGHLRAARKGTPLEARESFLALHLSGGTTDLLFARGEELTRLGSSLDLHAGQLMDRVGVALGCSFPAGPEMEALALRGVSASLLPCAMTEGDLSCHLSGAEAQAMRWIQVKKLTGEDLAREVFDLLARTVLRMLNAGMRKTGERNALIFGGIASSGLFREMLTARAEKGRSGLKPVFGSPALSGDNAVGVALTGADQLRKSRA